jgi:nucleoside-diphosphate-sugar epimerase
MRVFVTGGTGFVGSHIVEHLLEAGHDPLCLVRETSDTTHLDALGVDQHLGTLDEVDGLRPAIDASDAVVHVAGVVKVRETRDFYRINGEATADLAELVRSHRPDLERFVYVSSIAAQGPGMPERSSESDPEPVSHYGRSKLLGEEGVREIADDVPVTIFRPPPVYGPRDEEMFALFRGASLGIAPVYDDGEARLSIVHVFDLARAVLASLERDHESGSTFPIDDGDHYSWREMVEVCGDVFDTDPFVFGVPHPLFATAAHVSEAWASLTRQAAIFGRDKLSEMEQGDWVCGHRALRERLDWSPEWPLERGAEQTAEWYRDEGWL